MTTGSSGPSQARELPFCGWEPKKPGTICKISNIIPPEARDLREKAPFSPILNFHFCYTFSHVLLDFVHVSVKAPLASWFGEPPLSGLGSRGPDPLAQEAEGLHVLAEPRQASEPNADDVQIPLVSFHKRCRD